MKFKFGVWLIIGTLVMATLACDLSVSGPTPPGSPIPVSTEAAGELLTVWETAKLNAGTGQVSVTVTEAQFTSYMAYKLKEQTNPPLKDVQVFLRDNKVQIFGTATAANVSTTALVAISATVTSEGRVLFAVDKADFGPVSAPSSLLADLAAPLNEAFTGQVGSVATGFKVTNILIADGQMVVTGAFTR